MQLGNDSFEKTDDSNEKCIENIAYDEQQQQMSAAAEITKL